MLKNNIDLTLCSHSPEASCQNIQGDLPGTFISTAPFQHRRLKWRQCDTDTSWRKQAVSVSKEERQNARYHPRTKRSVLSHLTCHRLDTPILEMNRGA